MLLLLISSQHPQYKFDSDMMRAQINSQTLLACPITSTHHISKVMNGLTLILTNELLDFENNVEHCGADGPPCMFIIANGCLTSLKPNMPFKYLNMACTFFPEHLCRHCQVLCCAVLEIYTKFHAYLLFLSQIHCKIATNPTHNFKYKEMKTLYTHSNGII